MLTLCAFLIAGAVPAEAPVWQLGSDSSGWSVEVDAEGARVDGLRIGRAQLWREGWRPALREAMRRDADGSVALSGERFTERWLDRDGAVEQRWELPRLPPGDGPLHVRVPLHRAEWIRDDERGVTLSALESGRELIYGHGFLIDADGRRWDVPAAHRDGAIQLSVPERVLAEAKFPVVLDPTISASEEFLERAPGREEGKNPSLAWTGEGFLVLFEQGLAVLTAQGTPEHPYVPRSPPLGGEEAAVASNLTNALFAEQSQYQARALLTDKQGVPLTGTFLALGSSFHAAKIELSWSGTHYIAAWDNKVARVTPSGVVVDPGGVQIPGTTSTRSIATATAGGTTLIVYAEESPGIRVMGILRDDVTGNFLSATPFEIAPGSVFWEVGVATDGTDFLVTWNRQATIGAIRVSAAGAVLDPAPVTVTTEAASWPAAPVIFTGIDYLVGHLDHAPTPRIRLSRISPSGPLATSFSLDEEVEHTWDGYQIRLAWGDDTGVLAFATETTWGGERRMLGISFTASGMAAGPIFATAVAEASRERPTQVTTAGGTFVAWQETRDLGTVIRGTPLDGAGTAAHPYGAVLSSSTVKQRWLAGAGEVGSHTAVAWLEDDTPSAQPDDFFVRLVDSDGVPVGPQVLIAGGAEQASASFACGPGLCLATWADGGIKAARFDPVLGLLDSTPISLPLEGSRAQVAAFAGDFVIFGADAQQMARVVRVTSQGLITESFDVGGAIENAALACGVDDCIVVGRASDAELIHLAGTSGFSVTRSTLPQVTGNEFTLAWDSQSYLLISRYLNDVEAFRIHEGAVIEGPHSLPAFAANETPTMVGVAPGSFDVVSEHHVPAANYTFRLHRTTLQFDPLPENEPPFIDSVTAEPVDEGTVSRAEVVAGDPEGSALAYRFEWGDGEVTESDEPALERLFEDDGTYPLSVTVIDAAGAASMSFELEVVVLNVAPTPQPVAEQEVIVGQSVGLQLNATDPAGDADPLSWSLLEGPGTVDGAGLYTWTPSDTEVGLHTVRAQVVDDDGGGAQVEFSVAVVGLAGDGGIGGPGDGHDGGRSDGSKDEQPRDDTAGCACDATSSSGGAGWLALMGLLAVALGGRRRDLRPRGI